MSTSQSATSATGNSGTEPLIQLPATLLYAWKKIYGKDDLTATLPEIHRAAMSISHRLSEKSLLQSAIPRELYHQISNKEFLQTDLGKFVQIAVLIGREVNPIRYFEGSGARWDGKSAVTVKKVVIEYSEDCDGHPFIRLEVSYRGSTLNVVKSVVDLVQLLY